MRAVLLFARVDLRRRWLSLLVLAGLVAIVGTVVLGAIGGARRTSTAPRRLMAAQRFPDLTVQLFDAGDEIVDRIRGLHGVVAATGQVPVIGRQHPEHDWFEVDAFADADPQVLRPVVAEGRAVDPAAADEVLVGVRSARRAGLRLGSTLSYGMYTADQWRTVIQDQRYPEPQGPSPVLRVVGLVRDVRDDADGALPLVFAGRGFASAYDVQGSRFVAVRLAPGVDVDELIERLQELLATAVGPGAAHPQLGGLLLASDQVTGVDDVRRLLVGGLLAFAAVASVAGLLTLVQAARRHVAGVEHERSTLAALGFDRTGRALGVALPTTIAAVVGAVLAGIGTYATSPLFPLGSFRALEVAPGRRLDVPASVVGSLLLAAVSAVTFLAVSWTSERRAGPRSSTRPLPPAGRTAPRGRTATAVPSCVAHLARAVSGPRVVRSVTVGAVLAVATVTCAIGFTGSISRLERETSRYGQAFDLQVELGNVDRSGDPSPDTAIAHLRADPAVADVTIEMQGTVVVGGRLTDAYAYEPRQGSIGPVMRAGRPPASDDEVAIGPAVARRLHVGIGGSIDVQLAEGQPARRLRVVGIGLAANTQAAAFASALVVRPSLLASGSTGSLAASVALVRFAGGADRGAAVARLDAVLPYGIMSESMPAPPAPVARLAQIGRLPLALGGFVLGLAVIAFAHALVVLGQRRRREFAVLRALGATPGQTVATVLVIGLSAVAIGVGAGAPLGVAGTRLVCREVFSRIDVVPGAWLPVIPAVLALPVGAIAAVSLAVLPARRAARGSLAEALRAE